ncbi:retrovirus-related pol polyprotein from transposon TNT 1-94 [Tanacetum coccineum]
MKNNPVCKENALNVFRNRNREQYHEIQDLKAQMQDKNMVINEYKEIICVSRPQLKCYQVKDKVVPNNSQVKFQKKEVEDHHRISSISKKTKSVTACNDSSNSRTSNVNAVCAECGTLFLGTVRFGKDLLLQFLVYGDLYSREFALDIYLFCERSSGNDLLNSSHGSDLMISIQELLHQLQSVSMAKASPTSSMVMASRLYHLYFDYITLLSKKDVCDRLTKLIICQGSTFMKTPGKFLKDLLQCSMLSSSLKLLPVRTDRSTESYKRHSSLIFKEEGIEHQTYTPRTPEQNGIVERQNSYTVAAASNMLSASLSFHFHLGMSSCNRMLYSEQNQSSYPLMEEGISHHK